MPWCHQRHLNRRLPI